MSIITFAKLITQADTKKIFLVEIEPSQEITDWTNHAGDIYYKTIKRHHVLSVEEDGSELTEVDLLSDMSAGEWFYDSADSKLYVQVSTGSIWQKTLVANYKLYLTNEKSKGNGDSVIFNDHFYEPFLLTIPELHQRKEDFFWGVSIVEDGEIEIYNDKGWLDDIFESYAWEYKPVLILAGGEDLPYSEYEESFKGKVYSSEFSLTTLRIEFVSGKDEWDTNIPLNTFSRAVYSDLDAEDVGRPIPLPWGVLKDVPAICTTLGKGTATSIHSFKLADTSINSIGAISQVYVKGNTVKHHSASLAGASFKLSSTIFIPGDEVTADMSGYESGTVMENPMVIAKNMGNDLLGIIYTSTNYDTATYAQAITDAEDYDVGLYVGNRQSALDVLADLMKSCLGTFTKNNSGKYVGQVWSTDIPESPTLIDEIDIIEGSLSASKELDDIFKTVTIGYRKRWAADKYSYSSKTSDITEDLHGIKRSKRILTLLTNENGVAQYQSRILLLLERATIRLRFKVQLQLANKNVGDRFSLSFKRRIGADNIDWLDSKIIEIYEIIKNFTNSTIEIIADDLKGIGNLIGHWTSDAPEFPILYGGGSGTPWDPTWSISKKNYAKATWGYWCDDDGFIDPTDTESKGASKWW